MTPELRDSRFMKAARCEPADTTPIWIMRQAGRYLPEYMAVRSKVTFLELCKSPELAAEVTLTAREILDVDAAILFADLLPILEPMGFDLEYAKGEGPVIHNPINEAADIDRVKAVDNLDDLGFVFDTVRLVRSQLPANIPLLGFAGAPFTLASYAIEGGGSRNYIKTKSLMYGNPSAWHTFMERISISVGDYLLEQIEAGCQAVQVFDSWAGCLSPADYQEFAFPHTKAIIDRIPAETPVINFLTGNPALLESQRDAGGQVMGLDWRVDLKEAWQRVGHDRAVQGNLDPVTLFADIPIIRKRAKAVLDSAEGRPGHIFNLGHGVMPDMKPENVKALVEIVHELGRSEIFKFGIQNSVAGCLIAFELGADCVSQSCCVNEVVLKIQAALVPLAPPVQRQRKLQHTFALAEPVAHPIKPWISIDSRSTNATQSIPSVSEQ